MKLPLIDIPSGFMSRQCLLVQRGLSLFLRVSAGGALLAGLVGFFLQWTVRDRVYPLSVLFYALPPWICVLLIGFWALTIVLLRRRWLVLAPVVILVLGHLSWQTPWVESSGQPDLLLWNVAGPHENPSTLRRWFSVEMDAVDLRRALEEVRPRVAVLIEYSESLSQGVPDGYRLQAMPGRMAVVVRKGVPVEVGEFAHTSRYRFQKCRIGGRLFCLVDIFPMPWYDRGPSFAQLLDFAGEAEVICGDFNTPYRSVNFQPLREHFSSGMTEIEHGRETWPRWFPVLALDHILVRKTQEMTGYQRVNLPGSDHCLLTATFEQQ